MGCAERLKVEVWDGSADTVYTGTPDINAGSIWRWVMLVEEKKPTNHRFPCRLD
jgi:hypothetical protein